MDHLKILKRALDITWRYRALWLFGALLALFSAGGGGGQGPRLTLSGEDFTEGIQIGDFAPLTPGTMLAIVIVIACLALVFAVIATIVRYVAETALIRMVDYHETAGQKLGIRRGFRLGWSRTAFRFFLLDLTISLPIALAFIILLSLALSPLLLWLTANRAAGIAGTIAAIGLVLLVILVAILVSIVTSLLMRIFRRTCALEGTGVIDAIRQGLAFTRRHTSDIVILALLMFGLGIAYAIVSIPIGLILFVIAGIVGTIPGLLVGWLTGLFFSGALPWIVGMVIGVPIFILTFAVPGLLIGGIAEVYQSSVWTLAYREMRAMEGPQTRSS